MAFFIDASDLLDTFGTDIKVWPADSEPVQEYPGGPTTTQTNDLSDENAEKRYEPVVPLSGRSSLGASLQAGGVAIQGMLVWYSKDKFKKGTIVEVPAQSGIYQVTDHGIYEPYSHLYEYVLESDNQNGISNE